MAFNLFRPTAEQPHIFTHDGKSCATVVLTGVDGDKIKVFTDPETAQRLVAVINNTTEALTAFIEEVRDFKPTVFSGRAPDPQDSLDDMMPLPEFEAFQEDAEALVGKKVRAAA